MLGQSEDLVSKKCYGGSGIVVCSIYDPYCDEHNEHYADDSQNGISVEYAVNAATSDVALHTESGNYPHKNECGPASENDGFVTHAIILTFPSFFDPSRTRTIFTAQNLEIKN